MNMLVSNAALTKA